MIELERHIEILLLSNDCVIVPELGGFMTHHVDARYDEHDGMFVPPIRTLGFNPQLKMNDSLLVQSYIEAYDISYPEALRRIEEEVSELHGHLETEGTYVLNGIGELRLNEEGSLEFEPCESGILTPALYGLSSFEMRPLFQEKDKNPRQEGPTALPAENAITIKMSWLRSMVAVAAALIAFLMIGTPVSNSHKVSDVQQSAFLHPVKIPSDLPQGEALSSAYPATFSGKSEGGFGEEALSSPVPSPSEEGQEEALEEASLGAFCIVMASQVTERNAQAFIKQLAENGYNDARILVSGRNSIRRVVYGCFPSESDASATLKELRHESRLFRETWIMEIK